MNVAARCKMQTCWLNSRNWNDCRVLKFYAGAGPQIRQSTISELQFANIMRLTLPPSNPHHSIATLIFTYILIFPEVLRVSLCQQTKRSARSVGAPFTGKSVQHFHRLQYFLLGHIQGRDFSQALHISQI